MRYRYYREYHPEWQKEPNWTNLEHPGKLVYKVGFYDDGTLYNPEGYPEEEARRLIEPRYAKWKEEREERRKRGAARAVITRARRREKLINEIADKMVRDEQIGPRHSCCICKRKLTDEVSIARGIGSECWQGILDWVERKRAAKVAA
jgi:hypothetical protein